MSGKFVKFIFLALTLTACAEQKYENNSQNQVTTPSTQKEGAADCTIKFKNSGNCLTWKWEVYPTESSMGSLTFKIFRLNAYDGSAIMTDPSLNPSVVLFMPAMGHGSSPTAVTKLDVGTFKASNVFFVMPGEWQIKFQLKDGSTVQDEAVVSLTF